MGPSSWISTATTSKPCAIGRNKGASVGAANYRAWRRRRILAWPGRLFWHLLFLPRSISRALSGRHRLQAWSARPYPGRRFFCRLAGLSGGLALALGDQFERFGEGDGSGGVRLGDRRIDLAPIDICAEAAVAHGDRAAVGMFAEPGRPPTPPPAALAASIATASSSVSARRVGSLGQGRVDLAVIDIGAEAALAAR